MLLLINPALALFLWQCSAVSRGRLSRNKNEIKRRLQGRTFSERGPWKSDESARVGSRMKLCGGERSVQEEKSMSRF